MADAFLSYFKASLPDELASSLSEQLVQLESGNFEAIFQHDLVQVLLGHTDDECTKDVVLRDFPIWNDYVFARLGRLLSKRQERTEVNRSDSPAYRQHFFLIVAVACLQAFLQSNVTGPPLPFSSAKVLLPQNVASQPRSLASIRNDLVLSLSVDGEAAYKLAPNVELFCLADAIITCPPIVKSIKAARWAKLRIDFMHQRLLSEISPTLQTAIYDDLATLETQFLAAYVRNSTPSLYVEFLLERAVIHTFHGFDKLARADLEQAAGESEFEFALTGRLGKRTKFQEKDVSQLVVLARSAGSTVIDGEVEEQENRPGTNNHTSPASENTNNSQTGEPAVPKRIGLSDDTLLEAILFSEKPESSAEINEEMSLPTSLAALDPSNQPMLNPLGSIILLSWASSITNTSPANGLTREETLPYANRVLEGGSSNWQIYTQALLVRSRIEGYRSRTIERGLLQLQALVDQVIAETGSQNSTSNAPHEEAAATTFLPKAKELESAPVSERLRYIYSLCSPTRWELEAELAARWVSLGGLRSALAIYERLEMWAEAALCWAATEREDKAKIIIRRQLFHATDGDDGNVDPDGEKWEGGERDPPPADAPRLYCILGDIDRDPAMYEKAWEVSNHRYARAQRSLGRHYFAAKDYAKAAEAYRKSLKVNQLNQSSWFALGCALLELARFDEAVEAFSRTVQLDDTDAEAWSNLAAALLHLEPNKQEEGVTETTNTALDDQEDEHSQPSSINHDPQRHRKDALKALKRAARLKYDDHRIWDNLLTVAAFLIPPSYTDVVVAQQRIIELRGPTVGEKCIDVPILEHLVCHIVASDTDHKGYDPARPGLARMVVELVDKHVVPLITASRRLWQVVARLALWRNRPGAALEAHEKAWRAVTSQPGWEYGEEARWEEVVDVTVELVDAYESLGGRERTEGLGAGVGEVVARDWKFKARSAVRGVMGRGKGSWEGTAGWERLRGVMEGLRA